MLKGRQTLHKLDKRSQLTKMRQSLWIARLHLATKVKYIIKVACSSRDVARILIGRVLVSDIIT